MQHESGNPIRFPLILFIGCIKGRYDMDRKTYCVYVHTNKFNGKKYVGQTCQKPEVRFGKNGSGYVGSRVFYNAILKYGWDNFYHE